jgi:hypothetical protein
MLRVEPLHPRVITLASSTIFVRSYLPVAVRQLPFVSHHFFISATVALKTALAFLKAYHHSRDQDLDN